MSCRIDGWEVDIPTCERCGNPLKEHWRGRACLSGPASHWVSCRLFTVRVAVDASGRIVEAAPLVRKFIGQPLENLLRWAERQGGLRHEVLG